ncbi:hypothetical protein OAG76_04290 [Rubripirellula sp.]|nr:hypothetical protein [Rubripirellula sp.]
MTRRPANGSSEHDTSPYGAIDLTCKLTAFGGEEGRGGEPALMATLSQPKQATTLKSAQQTEWE